MNNNQAGDPEKLATALIKVAADANPPLHLFLGTDAYNAANQKIAAVQRDLENWKSLTISTDFEDAVTV
ncbi:MAG: hypothetical protein H7Z37_08040 [Pyrinomonadaceae bacterium]|nr:hypothetical protein [Pyrinomonadaceae bacterium]